MVITKLRRVLGLESLEDKLSRVQNIDEELKVINSNIDELSSEYTNRNEAMKLFQKSCESQDIYKSVEERFYNFRSDYLSEVSVLKLSLDKLNSERDKLIKSPLIYKSYNDLLEYTRFKEAYKGDFISDTTFNTFLKAKQGRVRYSDNIVFNEQGFILILQRSKDDTSNPGKWCLPGGHVDLGEDFETAAKRELHEESGLFVTSTIKIGDYSNNDVEIEYYRSLVNSQEQPVIVEYKETQDHKWINPYEDIDDYEFPFNMKDNIKKILEINPNPEKIIKKAVENGLLKPEILDIIKSKAQIGEVRNWSGVNYKKVAQGEWVKVVNDKEKGVAGSGIIKTIKSEIGLIFNKFNDQKNNFEKSLEIKYTKGTIQYKFFFEKAWGQELDNNEFLKKIRQEQSDLNDEIKEIYNKVEVDKKQSRESKAGKKEIDYEDLNDKFKDFHKLFDSVNKEIPRSSTADKIIPDITVDDYYLDTETLFKAVEEYTPTTNKDGSFKDNVQLKWQEMIDLGKYEFTQSPKSGSQYLIDRKNGDVYRKADHWGRCASCFWDVDFKEGGYGIAVSNIKDFKRKASGYWFNPLYREKIVEAAELVLPKLNELVSNQNDFYLTDKAKYRVVNFSKKIFNDHLKSSALLAEEELVKLRKKYTDLFGYTPKEEIISEQTIEKSEDFNIFEKEFCDTLEKGETQDIGVEIEYSGVVYKKVEKFLYKPKEEFEG